MSQDDRALLPVIQTRTGLPPHVLRAPDARVMPWPVVGLQAASSGFWVLDASGRVLSVDWEAPWEVLELAPPRPWSRPQETFSRMPHTWEREGRILALPGGGFIRFLCLSIRHVRQPCLAEVSLFDARGQCLKTAVVSGVQPRLLAASLEGDRALLSIPGQLVRDPYHSQWITLEPVAAPEKTGEGGLEPSAAARGERPPIKLGAPAQSWGDFSGAVQALEAPVWLLWRDGRLSLARSTLPERSPERLTLAELQEVCWFLSVALSPSGRWAVLLDDRQRLTLLELSRQEVCWQQTLGPVAALSVSDQGEVHVMTGTGDLLRCGLAGSAAAPGVGGLAPEGLSGKVQHRCIRPDGLAAVGADGRVLSIRRGPDCQVGTSSPLAADALPSLRAEERREHLPPPRVIQAGRWRLSILQDWEFVDPYQSADYWRVLCEPLDAGGVPASGGSFSLRLPEQPLAWGDEPVSGMVLLRDFFGSWMAISAERRKVVRLHEPRQTATIAFCGSGWRYLRRSSPREREERGRLSSPVLELIELESGHRLGCCECREAERALAGSSDGALALVQEEARLRILRLEGGQCLLDATLTADEADSAEWQEPGGFLVRTRRGGELFLFVG